MPDFSRFSLLNISLFAGVPRPRLNKSFNLSSSELIAVRRSVFALSTGQSRAVSPGVSSSKLDDDPSESDTTADDWLSACDVEGAACDVEEVDCDVEEVACDVEEVACDAEEVACDVEGA